LFSETVALPLPFLYLSFEFVNSTIVKSSRSRHHLALPLALPRAGRVSSGEATGGIDLLTNRGGIIRKNRDGLHLICVEINFSEETRKQKKKKVLFVIVGSASGKRRRKKLSRTRERERGEEEKEGVCSRHNLSWMLYGARSL